MANRYIFYCKICGKEMIVKKKHATTCDTACRVALSNIMRYGVEDAETEEATPEEREEATRLTKKVLGQETITEKLSGPRKSKKKGETEEEEETSEESTE